MQESWLLYRFDVARYEELRPKLRYAMNSDDLAEISRSPALTPIISALVARETSITEARALYVQALCCVGAPLTFDHTIHRFISAIEKHRETEEAADTLRDLLAGRKNLESWMLPSTGLAGFLTAKEADSVRRDLLLALGRGRRIGANRRRRQGGLIEFLRTCLRKLVDTQPPPDVVLALLRDLLQQAAAAGHGIAMIAA